MSVTFAPPSRGVTLSARAAAMTGFKFKAGTVIFVAAMAFAAYLGLPLSWRDLGIQMATAHARGTITAVGPTRWAFSTKPGGGAIGTGTATVDRLRFRFADAEGRARDGVSYTLSTLHKPGDAVAVEFAGGWPSLSRIAGTSAGPVPPVFNTVLCVALVGFLLIASAWRAGVRRIRLLADGEEATARVVSCRLNPGNPPPKANETPDAIEVEFEFLAPDGKPVVVKQRIVDRVGEVAEALEHGPDVRVLYDRDRPQVALLTDSLPASAGSGSIVVFGLFVAAHLLYIAVAFAIFRGESIL